MYAKHSLDLPTDPGVGQWRLHHQYVNVTRVIQQLAVEQWGNETVPSHEIRSDWVSRYFASLSARWGETIYYYDLVIQVNNTAFLLA